MDEVASAQMMNGLQVDVVVPERPAAVLEHPVVSCCGQYFAEAGVIGVLRVEFRNQTALEPSGTAFLINGTPRAGPGVASMPYRENLSPSRPVLVPTA